MPLKIVLRKSIDFNQLKAYNVRLTTIYSAKVVSLPLYIVFYFLKGKFMSLEVGNDSVVIGNIGNIGNNRKIGNNCVIIGATDANGNCILNGTMAIGKNAHAGKNSIAIGTNAGAGIALNVLLEQLKMSANNQEITRLIEEMKYSQNKLNCWEKIKIKCDTICSVTKVFELVHQISQFFN